MVTFFNKNLLCIYVLLLTISANVYAQITIGKPTFGFTKICATSSFGFDISFSFSPTANLTPSNKFIVELSDDNFVSSTVVYTSTAGEIISSPGSITFYVPNTIAGENYKLRVKSTSPVSTSPSSSAFAAYYKVQDSQFTINKLVSTATFCSGGNYLLSIDNPGTGSNDSPLKYPSLTYNWFKDNGGSVAPTLVAAASTGSYSVTQPGTYYVETNYGTCTSDSYSNRVTVSESSSSGSASITSSLGNPYCSIDGTTTLSTTPGNSYQWSKEGVEITGATNQTYVANSIGLYSVKVDFGTCQAYATIDLKGSQFNSSINIPDTNVITPGEILNVIATTDAVNPNYVWYLNDVIINGANSSTYDVVSKGNYKLVITENASCITSNEISFVVTYTPGAQTDFEKIPNIISLGSSYPYNIWDIPLIYKNPNTHILIISAQGDLVLDTFDYQADWPLIGSLDIKNVNPVYYYIITSDSDVRKGSITVIK